MKYKLINEESINYLYDNYLVKYALSFSNVWMMNWGYWKEDTFDVSTSQINLIIKMIDGICLKNKRVLDIGCGVGGTAFFIQNFYSTKSVTGINISSKQVRMANELAKQKNYTDQVRFKNANASQLPFSNQTFDIAIVVESAFHFTRKDLFIKEVSRVLKPRGKLIMADLNLTEDSKLSDIYENKLIEFYEGLHIPDLARLSYWDILFKNNKLTKMSVENITEFSAISLSQILKNSLNTEISTIYEKQNNLNDHNSTLIRKWNKDWYLLLGELSFNEVISYNIISIRK